MIRFVGRKLDQWLKSKIRKPLVLRGARQVGKTWLVRDFAHRHGLYLIELNLERFPHLADLFAVNDPAEILQNIEAEISTTIDPASVLLFLDEIQTAPELFGKLRWFKEEMPGLPVIAAGSLLEFALRDYPYSMPTGRITYFYLEQMSFFEFLLSSGNEPLYQKLISYDLGQDIPRPLHQKCLEYYYHYCLVGGMPEVVQEWVENQDPASCLKLQQDLLATYRDDFHKYGGEMDARLLADIMLSVSRQLGNKFVYSRVDPSLKILPVKKAFSLLCQAKVCSKVLHTTGNGLPLGAESNAKFFKTLMIDIGLVSAQLGLSAIKRTDQRDLFFSNKGGLAEQFVGQQLRTVQTPSMDPQLFYWQRTGGRLGEIDYIIQHGSRVVPVEVKSGPAGKMKSLHQFMAEKKLDLAIRCNLNLPSVEKIRVKTTLGQPVAYRLVSIPIYLSEHLPRLIEQVIGEG
ncbi:MAG: ATP-binding protein [Desulfosarcina sp.]|nr:ATP-binding protein [Desulfosarcina sp.]MBC2766850.1 ATP-binding protein [Desulfosarcina sp.]